MRTERTITREIDALEHEKGMLVYDWIKANGHGREGDGAWPYAEGEKATAGRKREILDAQRALRAERKALKDAARAEREQRAAESKRVRTAARDAITAECQICEGRQCMDKSGRMVHHGYRRPGDGYIVGDCPGVKWLPFPATDALAEYLLAVEHDERATLGALAGLPERRQIFRPARRIGDAPAIFQIFVTAPAVWDRELAALGERLKIALDRARREMTRVRTRIARGEELRK